MKLESYYKMTRETHTKPPSPVAAERKEVSYE